MRKKKHLGVTYVPISRLKPRHQNPRTHSDKQLEQIKRSLDRFGFVNPVLIDRDETIIAGHGRVEAAKRLGMTEAPTICLEHMSKAEISAYVIADNRLAELAGWDKDILAIELQNIVELDCDFDLTFTGFETPEIDLLLNPSTDEADEVPVIDLPRVAVTRTGDHWWLGKHAILCADALDPKVYAVLLGRKKAQMVFTDPPYNARIRNVCGIGRIKHREFLQGSGEMSPVEFAAFLTKAGRHLAEHSVDGALVYVCIDWRHAADLILAMRDVFPELKAVCVWVKDNGGMGSLYRSQHEFVCVFKNGSDRHINNIELGVHGRYRTNVWDYPGVNTFREGRMEDLAMHPTVKPVALVADAILDCSKRGGLVLDCFGGSGTTLIAAERTGRRGYLIELDPIYVDVTIERFERLTGIEAVHAESGRTFAEIRAARAPETSPSDATNTGEESVDAE